MTLARRIFDEHRRVLLPLTIALAANVAVFVAAVVPLKTAASMAESGVADAMRALGEARRAERQAVEAQAGKARAETELRKFYEDVLPHDFGSARQTTTFWLTEAARDAGLAFKGAHFDWEPVRDSRLSRAFAKITLEGRYTDIRRFLYTLETAREFIIVERVELAEQNDRSASSGVLQVTLTVSTYFVSASR